MSSRTRKARSICSATNSGSRSLALIDDPPATADVIGISGMDMLDCHDVQWELRQSFRGAPEGRKACRIRDSLQGDIDIGHLREMTFVDEGSPLIHSDRFVLTCDCMDYRVAVPSRGLQAGGQLEFLAGPACTNVSADRLRLGLSVGAAHRQTIPSGPSWEKAPAAHLPIAFAIALTKGCNRFKGRSKWEFPCWQQRSPLRSCFC